MKGFVEKVKNLTPHEVRIINGDGDTVALYSPEPEPARLFEARERLGSLPLHDPTIDIPINRVTLGNIQGLPPDIQGVALIVSKMVADAFPEREDLYVPDEVVRDRDGNIIGCKALSTAAY